VRPTQGDRFDDGWRQLLSPGFSDDPIPGTALRPYIHTSTMNFLNILTLALIRVNLLRTRSSNPLGPEHLISSVVSCVVSCHSPAFGAPFFRKFLLTDLQSHY
jgi:hypothetical protein